MKSHKTAGGFDFEKLICMDIVIAELSPGKIISSLSDNSAEVCVIKSSMLEGRHIHAAI